MPRSAVEIDTTRLDRILRNLTGNIEQSVRAIAFDVEGKAKVNAQQMHVWDTGALVNSIYTRAGNGTFQEAKPSSFGAVDGKVKSLNPDAETSELPTPRGRHEAIVGVSVHYGPENEFGTSSRAGRPFLGNAVRAAEDQLARRFGEAVTDGE